MDLPDNFLDQETLNRCNEEEIKAIASKNWLSSTHTSLQHLDQIKATVYNIGIHDPKDLKGTNLSSRGGKSQSYTDLTSNRPLSSLPLHKNAIAWGSNGSIPDLLAQHSARSQLSDKSLRKNRPSSGKRARPQSAKELPRSQQLPPKAPSIGVKGAKVDPSGKPPKHAVHHTGAGWVGPPAGMKFPDSLPNDIPPDLQLPQGERCTPPAPTGSPVPPDQQNNEGPDLCTGDCPTDQEEVQPSPRLPTPEPIHFSIPMMEDDTEDSDLDTDRLLMKAEEHAPTPVIKGMNEPLGTTQAYDADQGEVEEQLSDNDLNDTLSNQMGRGPDYLDDDDDDLEDDWAEELADIHQEDFRPSTADKTSVKFREDKNVTIDITPRNLGYKVSDMDVHLKQRHSRPKHEREHDLCSSLSISNTRKMKDLIAEINQDTKCSVAQKSSQQMNCISKRPKSAIVTRNHTPDSKCERRLTQERPKSAIKLSNKPSTPVAMVTVAYNEEEDVPKPKQKLRKKKADIVTMVQTTVLSDSEEEINTKDSEKEGITPHQLESWMPTKCISVTPKNYYELSRRAAALLEQTRAPSPTQSRAVYKTTKTIEFDEYKPKETSIKSVIDNNALLKNKDKEKFVGLSDDNNSNHPGKVNRPMSERSMHSVNKEKTAVRPSSAMILKKNSNHESERPSSRIGYVAMAPEKPKSSEKKMLRRPLSGAKQKKVESEVKSTSSDAMLMSDDSSKNDNSVSETKSLSEKEKLIEDLINKHLRKSPTVAQVTPQQAANNDNVSLKLSPVEPSISHTPQVSSPKQELPKESKPLLLEPEIETLISEETKPAKPVRAQSCKENTVSKVVLKLAETCVHSKLTENTIVKCSASGHYASYSRGRAKSAPVKRVKSEPRIRYTKPFFINSQNPDNDVITEVDIETQLLHQRLAADDVHIKPETLEKALYPPSGRTTYYDIDAKLPKSYTTNLLSHPKVWLPVEYKQFKLAEKNLDRANHIMRLQQMAEERKARLAEVGTSAKKKKKTGKKGKKKGSAGLRKSKSIC